MARTRAAKKPAKKPKAERPPLPDDAVLLTLDASSTAIGWALFAERRLVLAGLVPPAPKGWDADRRIRHNGSRCIEMVQVLCDDWGLTHVAMEFQSHKATGMKVQGLAKIGQAQGYILGAIESLFPSLVVETISEREWTRWGGKDHRNAPKEVRAQAVMRLVAEYAAVVDQDKRCDPGLDAADAAGIGLWRLGII